MYRAERQLKTFHKTRCYTGILTDDAYRYRPTFFYRSMNLFLFLIINIHKKNAYIKKKKKQNINSARKRRQVFCFLQQQRVNYIFIATSKSKQWKQQQHCAINGTLRTSQSVQYGRARKNSFIKKKKRYEKITVIANIGLVVHTKMMSHIIMSEQI